MTDTLDIVDRLRKWDGYDTHEVRLRDAAADEIERLRKECGEERAAYLNASRERDELWLVKNRLVNQLHEANGALSDETNQRTELWLVKNRLVNELHDVRAYAENVVAAANNVIEECERRSADVEQGRARAITVPWLDLNVLRQTIAMKPGADRAQVLFDQECADTVALEAQPECVHETGDDSGLPGDNLGFPTDDEDEPTPMMREAKKLHDDLRHQSCTHPATERRIDQWGKQTCLACGGFVKQSCPTCGHTLLVACNNQPGEKA